MSTINLNNVGIIATNPLFTNLNFTIGDGDCVGLVAGNGGGKTTLFNCIMGDAETTSGEITCSRGLRIGMVEQGIPTELLGLTLRDAVCLALPVEFRETETWRAEVVLDGLETPESLRDRPVAQLSGGWQRLMLIARCWVADPDALLLDEPTNHLDLGKIIMLENWLKQNANNIPVIIASHDRDFLDATTNRTLFLRPGISHYFSSPYSQARASLEEADAAAERKLGKDLKEVQRLRRNAAKLKNIGINSGSDLLTTKAKQLKDRASKIEQGCVELHKERSGMIKLANSGTHAKVLISMNNVAVKTPDGNILFSTGKLYVFQGDRIIILGRNGVGKTRFIKLLERATRNEQVVDGIKVTPSVVPGYFDQELSQLDSFSTPVDAIEGFDLGGERVRALLAGAGFAHERQQKRIEELSFGQRSRLGLLVLRLLQPNFYLMDEPTNHVDIPAQEALEEEMFAHNATSVLVSHDRRFVRNVATRFLLIENNKMTEMDSPERFFLDLAHSDNQ